MKLIRISALLVTGLAVSAWCAEGRREMAQAGMPYTITEAGSYVVTENLTVADEDGITIAADHVTLDLNGFHLAGGTGADRGVVSSGPRQNVTVLNGTVRDWGLEGIDLGSASNVIVRNLRLQGNRGGGLVVGTAAQVVSCTAVDNGVSSSDAGIRAGAGCLIVRCVTRDNGGAGIRAGEAASIQGCVARANNGDGMVAGSGANVTGCNARGNDDDGFVLDAGSRISNSVAYSNDHGIRFVGQGGSAQRCTLYGNSGYGLRGGDALTVMGCIAYDNDVGGYAVSNACHLVSNNAVGIAGVPDGFAVEGDRNRLEGNHAVGGNHGFLLAGDENLVVKNSATDCTDEFNDTGSGNRLGPESDNPDNADPWDNFSY